MELLLSALLVFGSAGFSFSATNAGATNDGKIRLNEDEIRVTNRVAFENYQSTNMIRNPEELIIAIGSRLTREMLSNGKAGSRGEYFFQRIVPDEGKFGADLFSLGEHSEINHVVNLNRILQGYLTETYGYPKARAEAAATFILVYNAVIRNDRAVLEKKYSSVVGAAIPEGKLGIDLSYRNWPGKTTILIPTSGGNLSVSELGQKATGQPSLNRKAREEFVKLREEEVKKGENSLSNAQAKLGEEKQKLKQKEDELKDRETKATTPEEKQKVADEKKKLDQEKETLKAKEKDIDKKAVATGEEKASIQQEKEKLDATKPPATTTAPPSSGGSGDTSGAISQGEVFFLKTLGSKGANYIQQLLIINPKNDTVRVVPLDGISGSHFNFIEGDPLLIMTDSTGKSSDLFLARLDRQTLKVKNVSKDAVFHSSKIWLHEGSVYVIGMSGGQSALLKLSEDMKLLAKSDAVVFPDTQITFAEGKVYCTVLQGDQNSHIIVFSQKDLKKVTVIR